MNSKADSSRWDVAISLIADDEGYASELKEEIERVVRGEVFLYSRYQEEIAEDGQLVELFTRVFREARTVLVLYREGWGHTDYTSLEQDAIRGRRLRADPRGILVVSLDGGYPAAWYPEDQFRPSAQDFSIPQIAALVAARVQESGGVVGRESAVEKAERLTIERTRRESLGATLRAEGPAALEAEANNLYSALSVISSSVTRAGREPMEYDQKQRGGRVNYRWGSLVFQWHRQFRNSLDGAELAFSVRDQTTYLSGRHHPIREPQLLLSGAFHITLPTPGQWAWQEVRMEGKRPTGRIYSTDELADWLIGELLELTAGDEP
jgi:hypothetical protein